MKTVLRLFVFVVVMAAAAAPAAVMPAAIQRDETPPVDLPDGEGRKILETACKSCHGLEEVTKFKGLYTRDDWRDLVATMVKYGAELKESEIDVLVDYLVKNFGKAQ